MNLSIFHPFSLDAQSGGTLFWIRAIYCSRYISFHRIRTTGRLTRCRKIREEENDNTCHGVKPSTEDVESVVDFVDTLAYANKMLAIPREKRRNYLSTDPSTWFRTGSNGQISLTWNQVKIQSRKQDIESLGSLILVSSSSAEIFYLRITMSKWMSAISNASTIGSSSIKRWEICIDFSKVITNAYMIYVEHLC